MTKSLTLSGLSLVRQGISSYKALCFSFCARYASTIERHSSSRFIPMVHYVARDIKTIWPASGQRDGKSGAGGTKRKASSLAEFSGRVLSGLEQGDAGKVNDLRVTTTVSRLECDTMRKSSPERLVVWPSPTPVRESGISLDF